MEIAESVQEGVSTYHPEATEHKSQISFETKAWRGCGNILASVPLDQLFPSHGC